MTNTYQMNLNFFIKIIKLYMNFYVIYTLTKWYPKRKNRPIFKMIQWMFKERRISKEYWEDAINLFA